MRLLLKIKFCADEPSSGARDRFSTLMGKSNQARTLDDITTAQRFEAKYIISEIEAQAIIDYIEPYITTDKHVQWGVPYVINSLYLDNDELRLYWSSTLGEKNRLKLRIRCYTDIHEDPVFFEIKRRVNQVILKQRAIVRRDVVETVLRGGEIPFDAFLKPSDKERDNLFQFRDIMEAMNAKPRTMVRYTREAYMSNLEEPVRITFDRDLAGLPCKEYDESYWTYGPHWSRVDIAPVILEIKFTDTFPLWVRKMIQRFNLPRSEFAKYCACVNALKREGQMFTWQNDKSEDPLWSHVID